VPITLKINRTPCDKCSMVLKAIQQSRISGRRVQLTVLVASLYGGTRREWKPREDGPDEPISVPMSRSSLRALADLRSPPDRRTPPVKLGIWDIWDQIGAAMMSDDKLKGIDPDLVKQNQAQRRVLKNWLAGVQQRLEMPSRRR
jgi:hypothetical protein